MKLYLARHGESQGNQQKIHQGEDTPLSDIGLSQAKILAHRFKKIEIDIILSSSFKRAHQTAEEIAKAAKTQIETSPLFREYEWPPEMLGLDFNDPKAKTIRKKVFANIDDKNWRYSTEETFFELQKRANQARKFLENRSEENILLVSHAFFIAVFISETIFKGAVQKPSKFINYFRSINLLNTGLSVLDYKVQAPEFQEGLTDFNGWRLQTFNDLAHLG